MALLTRQGTGFRFPTIIFVCFALLTWQSASVHAATEVITLSNGKSFKVKTRGGEPRPVRNRNIEMMFMGQSVEVGTDDMVWTWMARLKKTGTFIITVTTPVDDTVSASFEATGPDNIGFEMFDRDEYPTLWAWIDDDEVTWFPFVFSFQDKESGDSFEIMQWGKYSGKEWRMAIASAARKKSQEEFERALEQSGVIAPHSDERGWRLGHRAVAGNQLILEYVLSGETVENWSELITVQAFPGLQETTTPEELMFAAKTPTLADCPDAMWNVLRQSDDEIVFEWRMENCTGPYDSDDQYEVSKIIRHPLALHRVAYTTKRQPHLPEQERSAWTERIYAAELAAGEVSQPIGSAPVAPIAEVFFTREENRGQKQWDVLMDDTPVAILHRASYVSRNVEPGWHLIWGDCKPEWLNFEAGRTYLIRIVPDAPFACNVDAPEMVQPMIRELRLEQVVPTEETSAALGVELSKYVRIKKKAGDPPTSGERIEIGNVTYRTELTQIAATMGPLLGVTRGTLVLADTALSYESKKHDIKIPVGDITQIARIDTETGTYFVIEYREQEKSRVGYFFLPRAAALFQVFNPNQAFLTLQNSIPLRE